jgi:hypothetical protein
MEDTVAVDETSRGPLSCFVFLTLNINFKVLL